MSKWHTWYKVLVGIWSVPMFFCFPVGIWRFIVAPESDDGPGWTMFGLLFAFGLVLFHFIVYKGIYLHYYKKQQKQSVIDDINALILLKEKGIISQDEYLSKVDSLKKELLGL